MPTSRRRSSRGLASLESVNYGLSPARVAAYNADLDAFRWLEHAALVAVGVLNGAGLPSRNGWFAVNGRGEWRELPAAFSESGPEEVLASLPPDFIAHPPVKFADMLRTVKAVLGERQALTAPWWAARVLSAAWNARGALEGGNAKEAFAWGVRLAQAAQGLDLEQAGWPLAAEIGDRFKRRTEEGHAVRARQIAERNREILKADEDLCRHEPDRDHSRKSRAQALREQFELSERQLRKLLPKRTSTKRNPLPKRTEKK